VAAFPEYDGYDGLGLAELVSGKQVTATELMDEAMARVEQRNPAINAVVIRMYDEARRAIASGLPDGQFTGVPYVLKDLGASYAGAATSSGSMFFRDIVTGHDSAMVARLKRAGLVIFGRTNTSELGLSTSAEPRLFGPTRNPWNRERSAGGSSGGAAAAVASGMVPMAHATDGGGSIRIPASACGLFGLKPTRARNPSGPDVGEGWSGASAAHAVTRSVRDSAALLDATSGPDIGDPYWAPPPKGPFLAEVGADSGTLRIAFTTQAWNGKSVASDCITAVTEAVKLCESLGHRVEEARPEWNEDARRAATRITVSAHTRAALEARAQALGRDVRPDDVETYTWEMAEYGRTITAPEFARSTAVMHGMGRVVGRFFTTYDILVTPTMCRPPYDLGVLSMENGNAEAYYDALLGTIAFTSPFNTSGNPAMTLPLHWSHDGLPIGVQFVGSFGDEATLFRLAAQIEEAKPWAHKRPRLD
jgi:amidase